MKETGDQVKLVIADNGSGFILTEEDERKSLGMQLIKGLSRELKGTVFMETKKGTLLTIEFKKESIPDPGQIIEPDRTVI